jgi:Tol biopolymer transport system component
LRFVVPWMRVSALGWTPDQRFLLFARRDGQFWRVPVGGGEAEPIAGSSVKQRNKSPSISPDGKTLVFSTTGNGPGEIWALENFFNPAPRSAK